MNTPEILLKAADVIDEAGWRQGAFFAPHGTGMCVAAAMFNGAGLDLHQALSDKPSPTCVQVRTAIERLEKWLAVPFIIDWNDAPERTAEQVTAALRECAMELAEHDGIRLPEQLAIAGAS